MLIIMQIKNKTKKDNKIKTLSFRRNNKKNKKLSKCSFKNVELN